MKDRLMPKGIVMILIVLYAAAALLFLSQALFTPSLDYALPFVGYGGTFRYPELRLGGVRVSLYWAAHGVGLAAMALVCLRRGPAYRVGPALAAVTALLLAAFGYLGAKLLYVAENWEKTLQYGLAPGGVSFFGTVLFMPLAIRLMALVFRKPPGDFLDYCTPAGLVMLICIRTGCFLQGCCGGPTLWAGSRPVVLPAQLTECVLDLLLLELLIWLEGRGLCKGRLYPVFMGGYGLLRFANEFLRDTDKGLLGLSHGQWFGLLCMALCAAVFLPAFRKAGGRR